MAQKESYPRISKIFYITCLDPFKRPNVSTQHYFYDHITVSLRATVPLIQKRQREILRKPNAMGSWRESRKGGKKKKDGQKRISRREKERAWICRWHVPWMGAG